MHLACRQGQDSRVGVNPFTHELIKERKSTDDLADSNRVANFESGIKNGGHHGSEQQIHPI